MIDETKIRMMTRLSAYEKNAGKKYMPLGHYFRTDYIWLQVLKSFIYGTIAFLMVVGVEIFCNFENLLGEIYNIDLMELARKFIKTYVTLMVIYLLITLIVSSYRYSKARKSLKAYDSVLVKLDKHFN